jgi:hypothetical protein
MPGLAHVAPSGPGVAHGSPTSGAALSPDATSAPQSITASIEPVESVGAFCDAHADDADAAANTNERTKRSECAVPAKRFPMASMVHRCVCVYIARSVRHPRGPP